MAGLPFNPFSGPFAGAPGIGGNPIDDEANAGPRCPKCQSVNFTARSGDYGITRKCLEAGCGEEWSGGSIAVSQQLVGQQLYADPDLPLEGPVPDMDIPVVQYTGAGFRDPAKLFGDDEW